MIEVMIKENSFLNALSRNSKYGTFCRKYRNMCFEAEIFSKTTVWGRKENYVSLQNEHTCIQLSCDIKVERLSECSMENIQSQFPSVQLKLLWFFLWLSIVLSKS